MSLFNYQNGALCAEQVRLSEIADRYGTPCFVYSRAAIEQQWTALDQAFGDYPHTICYAVKANSNLAVLNILARLGSGFDIVSEGELRRVIKAGGDPAKVVFSGVAKSRQELKYAIQAGIRSINVESVAELERVQQVARNLGTKAPVALRVNPDVDPQTHPYISTGLEQAKFGITMETAFQTYLDAAAMPNIDIHGIACHIGSQITTTNPFADALQRVLALYRRLQDQGIAISQLDLGGGLGINYQGESPPGAAEYVNAMLEPVKALGQPVTVAIEPGRYIVGNAGVLLTRLEYLKSNASKNFAIVDAGMNDLLRPSLYQAYHRILNVREDCPQPPSIYDVVGPVCESADVLGADRSLSLVAGDLLAVMSAGAYGHVMSSSYNSRPRPPEIMVDGDTTQLVRKRETYEDLLRGESTLKHD